MRTIECEIVKLEHIMTRAEIWGLTLYLPTLKFA